MPGWEARQTGPLTGRCVSLAVVWVAFVLGPAPCLAIQYDTGIKLFAEDGLLFDGFGSSVATTGSFTLVGAPGYGYPATSNAGAAFVLDHSAPDGVVEHKLVPADNASSDSFGRSIAISGDTAVVGAPYDDDSGANSGSAYVFRYDGSNWIEEDKLTPSDGAAYDHFGFAVAIDGDTILVGAPTNGFGRNADPGKAYVFRSNGESWVEEDRIAASDGTGDDEFGMFVALSGEVAAVGVPDNDATTDFGRVYVYRFDGADTWDEEATIPVPAEIAVVSSGASFGATVAVEGDSLLVGAYRGYDADANRVGTVYAYRYDGVDTWDQEARLAPTIPSPGYNYLLHFGRSIDLSGDTAVIGARGGILSDYLGAAHVFWYDGTEWVEQDTITTADSSATNRFGEAVSIAGNTVLVADLQSDGRAEDSGAVYLFETVPDAMFTAFDGAQYDEFGRAVAVSGDTVLVGAPGDDDGGSASGSAYLFWYDGANWFDEDKFSGAVDEVFGAAVALEGDTAVVGAPGREGLAGAVYVYEYAGEAWALNVRLTPEDSTADDAFGTSVAISGDKLVVGAPATDDDTAAGAAYVFVFGGGSWSQQVKLTASDGDPNDEFGASVGIAGDTVVVGAHYDDDQGLDAGAAYVFWYDGGTWLPKDKLTPAGIEADDEFGNAVANSNDKIVVGAKRDADNGNDAGAAYVFHYVGESWVQEAKLTASDGGVTDRFGMSVAISSSNTIAVGAEWDDQKGSAYVFWHDGASWVEEPKLLAPVRGTDYFGASISISDDRVLVGAPYANGVGDSDGAAYLSTVAVNVPEPGPTACWLAALTTLAALARARSARARSARRAASVTL